MSTAAAISIVAGIGGALFWTLSALVKIPDILQTSISGEGSITSIMQRQSRLSAIAAGLTAVSVLAQAYANYAG